MRLISKDDLTDLCHIMANKCDGLGESMWNQFATAVEWCVEVDAVPVVRCNRCKHYEGVHGVPGCAPCAFWGIGAVMWDDYCKRGERWKDDRERGAADNDNDCT